jgi:hypothetical protein
VPIILYPHLALYEPTPTGFISTLYKKQV